MPKKADATPAKTLNKPVADLAPPGLDDDGLPALPDDAFAAVEKEMETKAATGNKKKKAATALTETPLSGMPDLDGPDLDPNMVDPQPSVGGLATVQASLSEIADRLSDSNNSLNNKVEALQRQVTQLTEFIQVKFDDLKDSFHPILRDALSNSSGGGATGSGSGAPVGAEREAKGEKLTIGKLAKACGQSSAQAQKILDACYKFKNAVPFGKVITWMTGAGLTEAQAEAFLKYLGIHAEEYDALDGTDFPKL